MSILTDIAALAKAGYKYDQVKELITLTNSQGIEKSSLNAEDGANNEPAPSSKEVDSNEPDYKAMYESMKKDLEELQNKNTKTEVDDPEITVDSIVNDLSAFLT